MVVGSLFRKKGNLQNEKVFVAHVGIFTDIGYYTYNVGMFII